MAGGAGGRNEAGGGRPTRRRVLGQAAASGAVIATLANRPALGQAAGPSMVPSEGGSRLQRASDATRSYEHERGLLEDHYAHQLAALDGELAQTAGEGERAVLAAERARVVARRDEQHAALLAQFRHLPGFVA